MNFIRKNRSSKVKEFKSMKPSKKWMKKSAKYKPRWIIQKIQDTPLIKDDMNSSLETFTANQETVIEENLKNMKDTNHLKIPATHPKLELTNATRMDKEW
jgi:hypothetical protein